jgi:hypothetical protein
VAVRSTLLNPPLALLTTLSEDPRRRRSDVEVERRGKVGEIRDIEVVVL